MDQQILLLKNQANDEATQIEPQLITQSSGNKTIRKLEIGESISWLLSQNKHCAGYSGQDGYLACPTNNTVEANYEMCASCDTKQGFRSAFFFGGPPNDLMQEYLGSKHYIYLTFFQPNILKVGTAKYSRRLSRLIEQDALFSFFIAQTNGFEIQKLEKHISKYFGLTEVVYSRQKLKYLSTKIDINLARKQLNSLLTKLKQEEFLQPFFIENLPEEVDFTNNKSIYYPKNFELVKISDVVVGKFLGIRGKFLILDYDGQTIAISTKQIVGRYYQETEATENVYKLKGGGQLGLI